MALALVVPWGGQPCGATPLKPLLTPNPSSLAPIDKEAFIQRYGDEALFRLQLGVEGGERSDPKGGGTAPCQGGWQGSEQEQRFQAAVNRKQWYAAGEIVGIWRRQCAGLAPSR